jgi:hypothetical protein
LPLTIGGAPARSHFSVPLVVSPIVSFMKRSLRFVLLFALSLLGAAAAHARSPEDTLVAFVAAVQQGGLAASVRFIHSAELAAFRAEYEPEIAKRVKSGRTRERFVMFTDPYDRKKVRPFKDDADFLAVFIKWLSSSGMVGVTTFDNATVKPLGTVAEGDLRHVLGRFTYKREKQSGDQSTAAAPTQEIVSITSMKMDAGQPMLLLLPELRSFANLVRKDR